MKLPRRHLYIIAALVLCVVAALAVRVATDRTAPATAPQQPALRSGVTGTVVRVVDGDTIDVRLAGGTTERVRLIGVDTPEAVDPRRPVQCFGPEASARARDLLLRQQVTLELDPSQGERDRYGRLLAYVFLPNGRNAAEVLIAEGYGREYTFAAPYKYRSRFRVAEAAARAQGAGLWSPATCAGRTTRAA
ncbi:MAG: thermonuclease family protein [Chloroflexi bacterium]|nr:thermonuclease family protein [Chloroflexota bacterium]